MILSLDSLKDLLYSKKKKKKMMYCHSKLSAVRHRNNALLLSFQHLFIGTAVPCHHYQKFIFTSEIFSLRKVFALYSFPHHKVEIARIRLVLITLECVSNNYSVVFGKTECRIWVKLYLQTFVCDYIAAIYSYDEQYDNPKVKLVTVKLTVINK